MPTSECEIFYRRGIIAVLVDLSRGSLNILGSKAHLLLKHASIESRWAKLQNITKTATKTFDYNNGRIQIFRL